MLYMTFWTLNCCQYHTSITENLNKVIFTLLFWSQLYTVLKFCRDWKNWESDGARSDLDGGCSKFPYQTLSCLRATKYMCNLALFWQKTHPFLLSNSLRFFFNHLIEIYNFNDIYQENKKLFFSSLLLINIEKHTLTNPSFVDDLILIAHQETEII